MSAVTHEDWSHFVHRRELAKSQGVGTEHKTMTSGNLSARSDARARERAGEPVHMHKISKHSRRTP